MDFKGGTKVFKAARRPLALTFRLHPARQINQTSMTGDYTANSGASDTSALSKYCMLAHECLTTSVSRTAVFLVGWTVLMHWMMWCNTGTPGTNGSSYEFCTDVRLRRILDAWRLEAEDNRHIREQGVCATSL